MYTVDIQLEKGLIGGENLESPQDVIALIEALKLPESARIEVCEIDEAGDIVECVSYADFLAYHTQIKTSV